MTIFWAALIAIVLAIIGVAIALAYHWPVTMFWLGLTLAAAGIGTSIGAWVWAIRTDITGTAAAGYLVAVLFPLTLVFLFGLSAFVTAWIKGGLPWAT